MSDRRPIASRDTRLAARIAKGLATRGISPNHISQASMVFAAIAGLAFWLSGSSSGVLYALCLVVAALGCQFRLLCNLFDGMVAVEGGQGAADGPFWNEAPDRVADALILVGMGLGTGNPALGWAAATLAVGTAYIRELGSAQGLGAGRTALRQDRSGRAHGVLLGRGAVELIGRSSGEYDFLRGYCPCAGCQGHGTLSVRYRAPSGSVDPLARIAQRERTAILQNL